MTEAYIYDAVRTPRGKGKSDGSLHEVTPVSLATQVLEAVRDRNGIDSAEVEDVAFGCVSPCWRTRRGCYALSDFAGWLCRDDIWHSGQSFLWIRSRSL